MEQEQRERVEGRVVEVPIADLRLDPDVQIRRHLNEARIARYMEIFDDLPPVKGVDDTSGPQRIIWLANGVHRTHAGRRLGRTHLRVHLVPGTKQDAMRLAITENAFDNEPLSDDERRDAVLRLYQLDRERSGQDALRLTGRDRSEWFKRWAHEAGVSIHTVRRTLEAEEVRQRIPEAAELTYLQRAALAEAEQKDQAALARAARERAWGFRSIEAARKNLTDPTVPSEVKNEIRAGQRDPTYRVPLGRAAQVRARQDTEQQGGSNGHHAALQENIERDVLRAKATDALLQLARVTEAMAKLRQNSPQETAQCVPAAEREQKARIAEENAQYLTLLATHLRTHVLTKV